MMVHNPMAISLLNLVIFHCPSGNLHRWRRRRFARRNFRPGSDFAVGRVGADCHGTAHDTLAGSNQRNRLFRTRGNTQPAGLAGIGVRGKRLLPAVSVSLEFSTQA
jgi:hypothetical protein